MKSRPSRLPYPALGRAAGRPARDQRLLPGAAPRGGGREAGPDDGLACGPRAEGGRRPRDGPVGRAGRAGPDHVVVALHALRHGDDVREALRHRPSGRDRPDAGHRAARGVRRRPHRHLPAQGGRPVRRRHAVRRRGREDLDRAPSHQGGLVPGSELGPITDVRPSTTTPSRSTTRRRSRRSPRPRRPRGHDHVAEALEKSATSSASTPSAWARSSSWSASRRRPSPSSATPCTTTPTTCTWTRSPTGSSPTPASAPPTCAPATSRSPTPSRPRTSRRWSDENAWACWRSAPWATRR